MAIEFDDAQQVEQVCYELKLADFPRGQNRARINQLFNGWPPYSQQEVEENGIVVNVNSLEGTTLAHDARSQMYNAFLKPGIFFRGSTDMGPRHKRDEIGEKVTQKMNRVMKRRLDYFETYRSKIALGVLHGTGPAVWENGDSWCPDAMGIEDILIPGKTLVTMKNLPLFAIYHSFTAPELRKLTRGPNVDPGWNMKLANSAIEWAEQEALTLLGSTWPEVWSPEKLQERVKGDGGFYPGDTAPTVDCFDFYFWADDGKTSGWRRRIILDSWGAPGQYGTGYKMNEKDGTVYKNGHGQFLYDGGSKNFADKWQHIVTFNHADLSAVAPFQYHSIRGLGFLLYSVCHLQNRMRCKFSESVFEALMNYFRVRNQDDFQRALSVQLANRGFIDDTVEFVKAADRWQVNAPLIELGLGQNQQLINKHASSYVSQQGRGEERPKDMTATQWIGEAQNTTQLVSAAFNQAYEYQKWEDYEVARRFFRKNSRDPEVNAFQGSCLRDGIGEEYFNVDAWDFEHERVMGAGNMSLEMSIANWLMQNREKYDPDAQRTILRKATFAITGDPGISEDLVPQEKVVSNSVHDAQLSAATLMMALPMALKQGVNHQEYAQTLIAVLINQIQKITSKGGVATIDELAGLQNLAGQTVQGAPIQGNGARNHIEVLAEDEMAKPLVKSLSDLLAKSMNQVKAFAQRLMEQQGKAQVGAPAMDPKDQAKIQATQMQAQVKLQNMMKSHAQRTAQRQIQFEQQIKQEQMKNRAELEREQIRHMHELDKREAEHIAELEATERAAASKIKQNQMATTEDQ